MNEAKARTAKQINVAGFLSEDELHESAEKRIELITKEFTQGFEFLENYPKSVSIFGSSLAKEGDFYYEKAREIGRRIAADLKYTVITGGGPGIMEAANRGAFEAHGKSLGITIKLPHEQRTNEYVTDKISLTYFFARKVCLSFSTEAFIFFPGGYGTMDELFEILTLVQTEKISQVPVILYGTEYWKHLETFLRGELLDRKMIDPQDMQIFTITDDDEKVLDIIRHAPVRNGIKYNNGDVTKLISDR